jgi:hypothetical protein
MSERTRRIQAAAQLLEEGNTADAKEDLAWIDACSHLTAFAQKDNWLILLVACFLFVGFAFVLHTPSAEIAFELETGNVRLFLDEDWSYRDSHNPQLISDEVFTNNVMELSGPDISDKAADEYNSFEMGLRKNGREIRLDELILLKNAKIELNLKNDALNLYVKDSPLAGKLFVWSADLTLRNYGNEEESYLDDGGDKDEGMIQRTLTSEDSETHESIIFRTAKTVGAPVWFQLISKANWKMRGFQIKDIDFLEEYQYGSGIFESAVIGGEVRLLETGSDGKILRERDNLILKGVESRRLDISKGKSGIKIFFEGSVTEVLAGPKGFEKNLKPTLVQWLFGKKLLVISIFWVVFFIFKGRSMLDAILNSGIW